MKKSDENSEYIRKTEQKKEIKIIRNDNNDKKRTNEQRYESR